MTQPRVKRDRSPSHHVNVDHPLASRRCDIHACSRTASDARRIAELEAEVDELRGQMAALEAVVGVDLHDCDEVRALGAAQHRNGGGSGFGLLHVQHESGHRLSYGLLEAVRTETERLGKTTLERVSDTVLARWTMPHSVVPSLVAEHVVAPFADPDSVVSGPGAPGTAVLGAEKVRDACRDLAALAQEAEDGDEDVGDLSLQSLCSTTCCLSGAALKRFVAIVTPLTDRWQGLGFVRNWAAFRLARDQAAAADVFATAAFTHAAEWPEVFDDCQSFAPETLMRLAAFATSPGAVVSLCELLSRSDCANEHTSSENIHTVYFPDLPPRFWVDFFGRLAPHATTVKAAQALCFCVRACDGLRVDAASAGDFFVSLLPVIDTDRALEWLVLALVHVVGSFKASVSFPPHPNDFFREFFVPLARSAVSPVKVTHVCTALSATFTCAEHRALCAGTDMSGVWMHFLSVLQASPESRHNDEAVGAFAKMISLTAKSEATVNVVSDVVDTVVLPLVPLVLAVPLATQRRSMKMTEKFRDAVSAVIAYRSKNGDTSDQQALTLALGEITSTLNRAVSLFKTMRRLKKSNK